MRELKMASDIEMSGNLSYSPDVDPNMTDLYLYEDGGDNMLPWTMFYQIIVSQLYALVVAGRVVNILWYIIGFIGNWISMRIWAIPRMKRINASALYLVAVTVSDIAYLSFHIVWFLNSFYGLQTLDIPVFCESWNVLYMMPQYASQLLVLGFTAERFISIHRPFHSERFSRHQRAPREITAIIIIVVALSLPQGYFWTYTNENNCAIRSDKRDFYNLWSWVTEMLMFALVPFTTLVLNVFVMRATHRSMREHTTSRPSINGHEPRIHHKGKTCRPSTITLLWVSCFRIFTQLPVTIVFVLQNQPFVNPGDPFMAPEEMSKDETWQNFFTYYTVRTVIELIGSSHHALSIFIFYYTTKQFRSELRKYFTDIKNCVLRRPATNKVKMDTFYSRSIRNNSINGTEISRI